MHVADLSWLYPAVVIGALVLCWIALRQPAPAGEDTAREDRWLAALAPPSAAVALGVLLTHLLYAPFDYWNQGRLCPSFAFRYGFAPYAPPDAGPILNTIYGPVTLLSYWPCSFASDPTTATLAGSALSGTFYALPLLYVIATASGWRVRLALALFAFFITFTITGLSYSAVRIHADAPALLYGGLAAALLVRERSRPGFSAACAVAAVAAKQSMLPVLVALPALAWWRSGAGACRGYVARLGLAGAVALLLAASCFDLRVLAFNLVTIPARGGSERLPPAALADGAQMLVQQSVLLSIPLAYCALDRIDARTVALAFVGAMLVPAAVVGRVREGGYDNNFSVTFYFLLLALVHELAVRAGSPERGRAARCALLAAVGVLTVAQVPSLFALPRLCELLPANAGEQAFACARAHPGEVYFPYMPLSMLLAEGQLYHFEEGVHDRGRSGHEPTAAHYRAHLPPRMRALAWSDTANDTNAPVARRLLPEYHQPIALPELPGWHVLGRQP